MAIAKSLPIVEPFFMQECPLCGTMQRMMIKGNYVKDNKWERYPDMGYSFCNCRNIFFTKWENIKEYVGDEYASKHPLEELKQCFYNTEPGQVNQVTMLDPYFINWSSPHEMKHWECRKVYILWDMDSLADEIKKAGFEIISAIREMNVESENQQCFQITFKRPDIDEPDMRPSFEAAKKLFTDKKVIGVEIGINKGDNSKSVLEKWQNLEMYYLVDPYTISPDYPDDHSQRKCYAEALGKLSKFPNAKFIIKTSFEASKEFQDKSLDFVYIDGLHNYRSVLEDISLWTPKVKPGGIIGGHDYNYPTLSGLKLAVDEMFGDIVNTISRENEKNNHRTDWWVYL